MNQRVRVKICGLTRVEDAELAVALGADAIGMVFWPKSPRVVNVAQARLIVRAVPSFVARVGVFVDLPPHDVAAIAADVGLDVVQLHGSESIDDAGRVGERVLKAVTLQTDEAVAEVSAWPPEIIPLVDAHDTDLRGGTGRVANWPRAASLARVRPIVLAGGLHAENVATAMREVQPWAVDVSSGVESAPGIKNADRMRALFAAIDRENHRVP
jgi:phosphoribosylanthranilate isomerase